MNTIILAEDHRIVREGCKALLGAETDLKVIGEASDGLEAVALVEKLRPNVLVLDLMIPRLHGLEVIRQVLKTTPVKVVVLSMHAEDPFVREALRNGANAYVLKDSSAADLVLAIRQVLGGFRYLSPALSERAIDLFLNSDKTAPDAYESLTARERLIMQLAAEGLNNADIAKKLFISPRTAETHRSNLMRKLELKSQTDLVRFAIRKGVLQA